MLNQISVFFDNLFSKNQFGFRKVEGTQQCPLTLLEKWKNAIYKGKVVGALLTDLLKAFDCLYRELLIAKLSACSFSLQELKLIRNYRKYTKQRKKKIIPTVNGLKLFLGYLKGLF